MQNGTIHTITTETILATPVPALPDQLVEVDNFQVKRTLKPQLICKHPRLYEDYPGDSSH